MKSHVSGISRRARHEIEHGRQIAKGDTEQIWGWGTPAGRLRAHRRASLIVEGAMLVPNMQVLEIGCGTGMFTEIFARTGVRILALDISPDLLTKARARGLPKEQVTFAESQFENFDVEGQFDAVIGNSVLHHLEVDVALNKIYQLLKPGARMSFVEPNFLNPQIYFERRLRFLPIFSYVSPDETAFLRWTLRRQLEVVGFEDVKVTPFDWLHPYTPRHVVGFVARLGWWIEHVPGLRELSGCLHFSARRPSN